MNGQSATTRGSSDLSDTDEVPTLADCRFTTVIVRVDTVSKGQEKFAIFKKSQGMSGKVRKSQGMNSDSQ